MVLHQPFESFQADIVPAEQVAQRTRGRAERTFDLHPALFGFTIAGYFAFLGVMGLAFMNAHLAIPFVIFAAYIAMAFAVPGAWAFLQPEQRGRFQSWAEFMREGVMTGTGRLGGKAAFAQVMTLPILILAWGVAILIIRMTV